MRADRDDLGMELGDAEEESPRVLSRGSRGKAHHAPRVGHAMQLTMANLVLGIIHASSAICFLAFSGTIARYKTVAMYSNFSVRSNPVPLQRFELAMPLSVYSTIFCGMAAINHMWVATVGNGIYLHNLALGRNPQRWLEYFFSASIMHVQVAQLCGITDVHVLFAVFGLTATCMLFGYLAEPRGKIQNYKGLDNEPSFDSQAFWLGMVPYFFQFAITWCYFSYATKHVRAPDFVYVINVLITLLDLTFALNLGLAVHQKGWWRSYEFTEAGFLVLSLTSKMLLAWITFGGTMAL